MSNEEKAREILNCENCKKQLLIGGVKCPPTCSDYNDLMKMARWKDEQNNDPLVIVRNEKRKINPIFKDIKETNPELYEKIEKMMTCYYYHFGNEYDECSKGLEGTPCDPNNCVAWRSYKEKEK